jgi:hypothetical protein
MQDFRLRIPGDPEYFHALGLAVTAFARLEWDAVWVCEQLQPGYLTTIEEKWEENRRVQRGKTAGVIAEELRALAGRVLSVEIRGRLVPLAEEFSALVKQRNGLLHGNPGTGPGGEQMMFRHGSAWTLKAVNTFADRCVAADLPLNALLHEYLMEPGAVRLGAANEWK